MAIRDRADLWNRPSPHPSVYTLLNLLGIYHDSIVMRTVAVLPSPVRPPSSSHARYTRHFTATSPSYAVLARSLTIISYTELLLEMAIRKRIGRDQAEKAVVAIEAIKAALRLAIMRTTKGRTGVNPPIAEREFDPSVLDLHRPHVVGDPPHARISFEKSDKSPRSAADVLLGRTEEHKIDGLGEDGPGVHQEYWKGARTGYARPTIASIRGPGEAQVGDATALKKDSVKDFLMTRVLTVEDVKRPQDLVHKARGTKKLAEVIWILRPLLYGEQCSRLSHSAIVLLTRLAHAAVLAMRRYGRRHTLPFLLSLALEYLSYSLRVSSTERLSHSKASGPMLPHAPSELEKQETKKRARMFWWYFLRGPMWESWTKCVLVFRRGAIPLTALPVFVALTLTRSCAPFRLCPLSHSQTSTRAHLGQV